MDRGLAVRLEAVAGVSEAVAMVEVDSTNLEAGRRIADGAGPGLVVTAQHQTAGRGRRGRSWTDVAGGNLALSLVVAVPRAGTLLPLVAALALDEVLVARGVSTSLKWPNDVRAVVDGVARKCAGILVETRPDADGQTLAIVGIGVDVDWRHTRRSTEARPWTSVAEALGHPVDVDDLAVDLVDALGRGLSALRRDPAGALASFAASCDTIDQRVRVQGERSVLVGRATGLADDGALVLDVGGRDVVVTAGDVVHLRPAD